MKKLLLPLMFIALFSCQKDEEEMTKIIQVELKQNESFSYTINSKGEPKITQQALHAKESKLKNSKCSSIFEYTPENNFSGNDEVIVHDGRQGKGHCHKESGTDYVFKIAIASPSPNKPKDVRQAWNSRMTICPAF